MWEWRGTPGDYTLLGAAHLLTAIGFAMLVSRSDPLRDTALFDPGALGPEPVRSDDIHNDGRYKRNSQSAGGWIGQLPVASYLAVPVVSKTGQLLGGLFFGHPEPGVFGEREKPQSMCPACGGCFTGGLQPLQRELADRFEHPQARESAGSFLPDREAVIDERLASLQHVAAIRRERLCNGRAVVKRATADEDCQTPEERLFLGREEVVTSRNGLAKAVVTGRAVASSGCGAR